MTERHEARAREMVRAIYQQEPQEHEAKEIAAWFRAVEAEALERAANAYVAQREHIGNLEGERASLADVVNSCLREAGIPRQAQRAEDDLRPLVEELLFALNRERTKLARLEAVEPKEE